MKNGKKILRKNNDGEFKPHQAKQRYSTSKFLPKFCNYFLFFECDLAWVSLLNVGAREQILKHKNYRKKQFLEAPLGFISTVTNGVNLCCC
jgi:hypothetical protein